MLALRANHCPSINYVRAAVKDSSYSYSETGILNLK